MKEYYCQECGSKLQIKFRVIEKEGEKREIPIGSCRKCGTTGLDLNDLTENHHMSYRDNIHHCPNCGRGFRTNYGHGSEEGYRLNVHTCPRCRWHVGYQQTFSHGAYVVAMESIELWNQRLNFWKALGKYGRSDVDGY